MSIHADIVIVGAGLVGSAMACVLAEQNRNLSILLLDSSSCVITYGDLHFDPRVVALSATSIHLLESIGVWDVIKQQRACAYQSMSVWDGEGNGSIAFHSADIHSPHLGYIVENSILLKVLRNKLEQYSHVQFLAPAHVEAMSLASSKSLLRLRGGQSITADFIVGADGANSVLRTLADIKTREWSYGHKAIVTTVRVEKPHQNTAWQRFSHQGPLAFLPLQGNAGSPDHEAHYCSIVWSLEDKASEQMMALAEDEFCHELSKTFEYRLGSVDWSDERHCIPLRQRNALSYGVSGFALVGDAAHTIHPLAGLGVNLGLADVQSLSAEILRAHMRKVPLQHPSIVKRYQRSRKPQNLLTMAAMEGFKQLFGHSSLSAQSIRNRGMDWVDSSAWLKRWIVEEIAR